MGLNRRGPRGGSSISSRTRQQIWDDGAGTLGLDYLGNRGRVRLDLDGDNAFAGTGEYDDDRTNNIINELTGCEDDVNPKEQFVYHNAGLDGRGRSSYIDSVILRDKDANSGWTSAADGTLEERRYLCQNWRADVSAIVSSGGYLVEWAKYSPYGTPFGLPGADTDSDGDCDATDITQIQTWIDASSYDVRGDVDLDGDVDATDKSTAQSSYQGTTSGWNDLTAIGNRKGYAGYEWDSVVSMYHVRNHVLHPVLGRWTRRDPLGEIAFKNSTSANISKPCSECDDTSGGIEQQSDRNPSPGTGCMVDGQIPLYSLSESDRPSLMAMESAVTRIGVSHPVQLSYKYGANLYESHVSQPCSMQDASGLGCTGAQKIACGCSSWLACCKCRTGVWTPGGAPEAVQPCIMTFPPPMAAIPGGTCTALVPMVACQSCTGRTWWSGKICTKCRRVPAAPPTVTATGVIVNSWNGMPQCRVVVGGKTLDC